MDIADIEGSVWFSWGLWGRVWKLGVREELSFVFAYKYHNFFLFRKYILHVLVINGTRA